MNHPLILAAAINYSSPIFWAVMIGWIMSVTLHEFAHGIVAYWGGDYTVRDRGLLTLNPLKYANPLMTFILPLLFVAMGSVPMVGAATYINVNLLRSRWWRTLTALAGPMVNLILFVLCVVPLYPRVGWVDPLADPGSWSATQIFCGTMVEVQFFAFLINLIPIPPLDGFNAISPYLPRNTASRLREPQISLGILLVLFFVLTTHEAWAIMREIFVETLTVMGVSEDTQYFIRSAYNMALFKAGS
jgi:Zn-dependent protease